MKRVRVVCPGVLEYVRPYDNELEQILETELLNENVPKDYGTQTDVHPWMCRWDREKLSIRYPTTRHLESAERSCLCVRVLF
jgi:hypothetical protein